MGNSEKVADQHYLQVRESHLKAACSALQNPVQHIDASGCIESHEENGSDEIIEKEDPCSKFVSSLVGDEGLELARQDSIFSDSDVCAAPGAALAPDSGPIDPGLAEVIDAWPGLPEAVRANILAMVRAVDGTS
jgi:hypothetical protein